MRLQEPISGLSRARRITLFAIPLVLAGLSCKPTKADVVPLVDARLCQFGLVAACGAGADAGASRSAAGSSSASTPVPPKDPAEESLLFLARLEELMKDYRPVLPPNDDSSDLLRCITTDALATEPSLQRSAATFEKKRQTAERKRRTATETFLRDTVPLQYRIDYGWKERGSPKPAVYSCESDTYVCDACSSKASCDGKAWEGYGLKWILKAPEGPFLFTYSGTKDPPTKPPELMTRIDDAHIVTPERFACRVFDVFASGTGRFIVCYTDTKAPTALRVSGKLDTVHVGDVVSVPLAGVKRDPSAVLSLADVARVSEKVRTWLIDADAASVVVDQHALGPSTDEILTASKP
jgi:hypothetical protein